MHKEIVIAISTALCLIANASSFTEGTLFKTPTWDGVITALFWEPVENAKATVFLSPGGGSGFGIIKYVIHV